MHALAEPLAAPDDRAAALERWLGGPWTSGLGWRVDPDAIAEDELALILVSSHRVLSTATELLSCRRARP